MNFNKFVDGKELIQKAKEFATKCHEGQHRKVTGDPYIVHPEAVAGLVDNYHGSSEMVAAAWLHDVMEDCNVKYSQLVDMFGKNVANFVKELTNPPGLDKSKKSEYVAHKMSIMSPEALTIKLSDRLHNVSDLDNHPNKKYGAKTKFIMDELESSGRPLNAYQKELITQIREMIAPYENI